MAVVAATAAVLAWKARGMSDRGGAIPPTTQSVVQTPPSAPIPAPIPPQPPSAAVSVALPTSSSAPPPTITPPQPSASNEKLGRATATLVGDPGTHVLVDGVSRGTCPVSVNLEPGQHEIRFMFDATGESRGERVGVKAGDKLTVRASFTGATPTIRIQR
jgi:hypothetical protein